MSLNFIPTVWAARLLVALENSLVYAQALIVNRDYEGEIRQSGDTVKVATIGDITVGNYTKDTDIANPQILTDAEQSLVIDQSKYFNFYVDQISKAQQNVNAMDQAMRNAGFALRDVADKFVASAHVNVPVENTIGTDLAPVVPTDETAY